MPHHQISEEKQWTFTYADGTKTQLDHILKNKRRKNSAINCQAFNTFEDVSSYH